jgi:hypothetical protein
MKRTTPHSLTSVYSFSGSPRASKHMTRLEVLVGDAACVCACVRAHSRTRERERERERELVVVEGKGGERGRRWRLILRHSLWFSEGSEGCVGDFSFLRRIKLSRTSLLP